MKDKLIKFLGGYTEQEYQRVENKYQGLLDSKTKDINVAKICNEYLWRCLDCLDKYMKNKLYGLPLHIWSSKIYNVIHNNSLRILTRYLHAGSTVIYKIDTTLDQADQFQKIMDDEGIDTNLIESKTALYYGAYKAMWEELLEESKYNEDLLEKMEAIKQKHMT